MLISVRHRAVGSALTPLNLFWHLCQYGVLKGRHHNDPGATICFARHAVYVCHVFSDRFH
ncbi:hypothetical protein PSP6_510014 [Paraburkholderia tropica]|nr:hypothetical protein PSP6_510014 [Paraburkholderia tropica]